MTMALRLARRGLGDTWPNPAVGTVIVNRDGSRILGRGWTQPGGRPHAETQALDQAVALFGSEALKGATAYVSLEPCSHDGKTPSCAQALADAGIAKVVVPMEDPDDRVSGRGLALLGAAGVEVVNGIEHDAAEYLNEGFLTRVRDGRPMVTLKTATSLDGKIATRSRQSQWITGVLARRRAHLMRAEYDAVMVGTETAILDNPSLTCRLPGLAEKSPMRIVVDSRLRLPLTADLVVTATKCPTLIVTLSGGDKNRVRAFKEAGVKLIEIAAGEDGRVDLATALGKLGTLGLTRILVEGGAQLAASLMRANLVDRIAWFRAPAIIGGDGLSALAGFGVDTLDMASRWDIADMTRYGDDVLEIYRRPA